MGFFRKKKKKYPKQKEWKITNDCLDLIFACSKDVHPNEFGGLLRVDDTLKDTITELMMLPGTIHGDSHAIFRLHMMPVDFSVVGTIHSHPGPSANPSKADLALFSKHGKIHIISASPYNSSSFKTYNQKGEEIKIKIV